MLPNTRATDEGDVEFHKGETLVISYTFTGGEDITGETFQLDIDGFPDSPYDLPDVGQTISMSIAADVVDDIDRGRHHFHLTHQNGAGPRTALVYGHIVLKE